MIERLAVIMYNSYVIMRAAMNKDVHLNRKYRILEDKKHFKEFSHHGFTSFYEQYFKEFT